MWQRGNSFCPVATLQQMWSCLGSWMGEAWGQNEEDTEWTMSVSPLETSWDSAAKNGKGWDHAVEASTWLNLYSWYVHEGGGLLSCPEGKKEKGKEHCPERWFQMSLTDLSEAIKILSLKRLLSWNRLFFLLFCVLLLTISKSTLVTIKFNAITEK